MTALDIIDSTGNIIAVLIPIGAVLYAIWRRVGGVLDHIAGLDRKLDSAMQTQDTLALKIDKLEAHQKEINGGIVKHMQEDTVALGEIRAAVAHVEGRLDERTPRRRATA